MMLNSHNRGKGFTLIEIIVSLSVFSAVILIVLGAVISIMNLQRKTNAFRAAQENLSYAFESIAKEIRTGSKYRNTDNQADSSSLDFINDQAQHVFYRLNGGQIEKCVDEVGVAICTNSFLPLTSTEISIDSLHFTITGVGVDQNQPRIRMLVFGEVGKGTKYSSTLFLQTVVTQRKLDS